MSHPFVELWDSLTAHKPSRWQRIKYAIYDGLWDVAGLLALLGVGDVVYRVVSWLL